MSIEQLIGKYGLYLSAYIVGVISGYVPVANLEVFLIAVASISPRSEALPITFFATIGQMTAKIPLYLAGAGILKLSLKKSKGRMERIFKKMEQWQNRINLFIFISACLGVPPFYLVSIACGWCKISFLRFVIIGFAGRFVRFALVVFFPNLIKILIS